MVTPNLRIADTQSVSAAARNNLAVAYRAAGR
jgi:hypothetical protein